MRQVRERLTYANVVSTLALFLVLSGGAAFAARNIGPNDIKSGAVKTRTLARNAVKSTKIAPNAVKARNIAVDAVGSRNIAPGAVGSEQLAPNSVDGSKVRDGSLTPADLLGGASVVATANGSPVAITATGVDQDPIPLSGGSWTQGPTQNNLFLVEIDATLVAEPASSCEIQVTLDLNGDQLGVVVLSKFSTDPVNVRKERLLDGVSLASGSVQANQLSAGARRAGLPDGCESATINSVRVVALGLG